jgi:hypothetical protein
MSLKKVMYFYFFGGGGDFGRGITLNIDFVVPMWRKAILSLSGCCKYMPTIS